jgi:hypothetical protein
MNLEASFIIKQTQQSETTHLPYLGHSQEWVRGREGGL